MNDNAQINLRPNVDGIIMVTTCHKHLNTRVKEFKYKSEYSGWKTIYVIGNILMHDNYQMTGNILTIKCEDSYIHLLKKVGMAIEILMNMYTIKEGIIRCGDDLIFCEDKLEKFIKSKKTDYMGCYYRYNGTNNNSDGGLWFVDDTFMVNYYVAHPEDFNDPLHGLTGKIISTYIRRPEVGHGISGVFMYLSITSCNILINHLQKINYDIFTYDQHTNAYPYTIEDVAIGYILYINKIYAGYLDILSIVTHTNKYK